MIYFLTSSYEIKSLRSRENFSQLISITRPRKDVMVITMIFVSLFVSWGRKKVVVIGLVVAAIANLIVTFIPGDGENSGETLYVEYCMDDIKPD